MFLLQFSFDLRETKASILHSKKRKRHEVMVNYCGVKVFKFIKPSLTRQHGYYRYLLSSVQVAGTLGRLRGCGDTQFLVPLSIYSAKHVT